MQDMFSDISFLNLKIRNLNYAIFRSELVYTLQVLARLYGCKNGTKDINKVVNRNIKRFPDIFCFQLTKEDINKLLSRSQNVTLIKSGNLRGYNLKYLSYVLTE